MFRTSSFVGATGTDILRADAKTQRRFHEHKKLYSCASAIAYAQPGVVALGDDPAIEHLAAAAGFEHYDLAILRLCVGNRKVTVVGVPTRIWRDPDAKASLLEMKRDAATFGTTCILVPQRSIKGTVRASIARDIARSRGVRYRRAQMDKVLAHLRAAGVSTIAATAAAIADDHDDPYAVVLSLASAGIVDLDRSGPLRASTLATTRH